MVLCKSRKSTCEAGPGRLIGTGWARKSQIRRWERVNSCVPMNCQLPAKSVTIWECFASFSLFMSIWVFTNGTIFIYFWYVLTHIQIGQDHTTSTIRGSSIADMEKLLCILTWHWGRERHCDTSWQFAAWREMVEMVWVLWKASLWCVSTW